MSHAHEKTLLARLGFSDPDRKEPLHDLACMYLSRPEAAGKIALLPGEKTLQEWQKNPVIGIGHKKEGITFAAAFERMICSGRFTVGFVDLTLQFECVENRDGEMHKRYFPDGYRDGEWKPAEWKSVIAKHNASFSWRACVEVKIQRFGVGEVIRQINLYRANDSYQSNDHWILASPHSLPADERSALLTANITPIRLGPAFLQWVEERKQQPVHDPSVEL